jgi:uncharacterized protein (TIGR01244 family)
MSRAALALVAALSWPSPAIAESLPKLDMMFVADFGADLVVGSQPTRSDLALLKAAGVTAVVDLRSPGETRGFDEAAVAAEIGIHYVNLPIAGADDVTARNAAKLDAVLQEQDGKALVHCASSNRAGALIALRAAAAGASVDDALAIGRRAGMTSLEPVVRSRIETGG